MIHKLQRCAHWSIASTGLDFIFCPDMTSEDYESNDQVSGASFWEKVTFALRGGGGWMNIYLPCIYDSIATVGEIRVYWRADFQSGSRVLKKVF